MLEERDKELSQYDDVFEQLKNVINSKSAEISELYIRLDQLTNQIAGFQQEKADLRRHYTESERIREESGRDLEELLRRKDQEHRLKVDEMVTMVMTKESQVMWSCGYMWCHLFTMQIKQLSRQLATYKASLEQSSQRESTNETLMKKMEQEAKKKEWTMVDEINAKDIR